MTFALARYTRAGRLDTSFGRRGRVTTDFTPVFDGAFDLAIQPDGRIVAAGTARIEDFARSRFALARYTRAGRLDTSFGGGRVTTLFGGDQDCGPAEAHALARQPDGRLLAAGVTGCGQPNFALARFRRDGNLDLSFGGDGKVATLFGERDCSEHAEDVAVQLDGRIVAVGVAGCTEPHPEFALARYLPGGTLDASFSGDGLTTAHVARGRDCFDQLNAVGLQGPGRIVAAGTTSCPGTSGSALLRYIG
jgi:uncharacterized delta-60 repeat protein